MSKSWASLYGLERVRHTLRRGLLEVTPISKNSGKILKIKPNENWRAEQRKGWLGFLTHRKYEIFATLTYDREIAHDAVKCDLKHFSNRLNSYMFGSKKLSVSFVAFIEKTSFGRAHVHLLLEKVEPPAGKTQRDENSKLRATIRRAWMGMQNSPRSTCGLDIQLVDQGRDQQDLVSYLLKSIEELETTNFDFVVIDFLKQPTANKSVA